MTLPTLKELPARRLATIASLSTSVGYGSPSGPARQASIWRPMNAAMPGTVKATIPCSGAYTRPLPMSAARVGPRLLGFRLSLAATSPEELPASPSAGPSRAGSAAPGVSRDPSVRGRTRCRAGCFPAGSRALRLLAWLHRGVVRWRLICPQGRDGPGKEGLQQDHQWRLAYRLNRGGTL